MALALADRLKSLKYAVLTKCGMVRSGEPRIVSYDPGSELEVIDKINAMIVPTGCDRTAVEKGHLIHPYPAEWPWLLITPAAVYRCSLVVDAPLDAVMRSVLCQAIRDAQRHLDVGHLMGRFEVEDTAIGTLVVTPNSEGGMTVGVVNSE